MVTTHNLNKYLIECQSKQTIYHMAMDGSCPTGVSVYNIPYGLATLHSTYQIKTGKKISVDKKSSSKFQGLHQ